MTVISKEDTEKLESRALTAGMIGNLFMGVAGVIAAYLSHSQAILVDGLFSLIGFSAALLGKRVARNARRQPDKFRPYGYAGDEAIFTTFRALSLLGLVLFAIANALMNILGYVNGAPQAKLIFEPMAIYFVVVGLTCVLLWAFHRWSWKKTGNLSEVLRLESKAAAFDGIITGAAAVGLLGIHFLKDGFLAPIAPVGDSVIVLVLCTTVVAQYFRDFIRGLGELAGVTASPRHVAAARRAARHTLTQDGGLLCDLSVSKLGRLFTVFVYYDPNRPVLAEHIDALTLQLQKDIGAALPDPEVFVVISKHGRVLPTE